MGDTKVVRQYKVRQYSAVDITFQMCTTHHPLCPSITPLHAPLAASYTAMDQLAPPTANCRPSGDQASARRWSSGGCGGGGDEVGGNVGTGLEKKR